MKLIVMEVDLRPGATEAAVAAFDARTPLVRAMKGCVSYALYRAPAGDRIAVVQAWESLAAFDAYRGSDLFAALGAELRPLMAGPPATRTAETDG